MAILIKHAAVSPPHSAPLCVERNSASCDCTYSFLKVHSQTPSATQLQGFSSFIQHQHPKCMQPHCNLFSFPLESQQLCIPSETAVHILQTFVIAVGAFHI
mmetsp:Transcript_41116/g.73673  ORF Transcript_41116/g.73673 Transcript_41116/m.73673 type:complete len:101 (-) Transcript_41116:1491-1793(-)